MHRIVAIPFVFAALALAVPALACPKAHFAKKSQVPAAEGYQSEAAGVVFAGLDDAAPSGCAAKKARLAGSGTCPFLAAKQAGEEGGCGGCGGCGGGCGGEAVFAATEPAGCGAHLAAGQGAPGLSEDEAHAAALRFVRHIAALFALDGVLVADAGLSQVATR